MSHFSTWGNTVPAGTEIIPIPRRQTWKKDGAETGRNRKAGEEEERKRGDGWKITGEEVESWKKESSSEAQYKSLPQAIWIFITLIKTVFFWKQNRGRFLLRLWPPWTTALNVITERRPSATRRSAFMAENDMSQRAWALSSVFPQHSFSNKRRCYWFPAAVNILMLRLSKQDKRLFLQPFHSTFLQPPFFALIMPNGLVFLPPAHLHFFLLVDNLWEWWLPGRSEKKKKKR